MAFVFKRRCIADAILAACVHGRSLPPRPLWMEQEDTRGASSDAAANVSSANDELDASLDLGLISPCKPYVSHRQVREWAKLPSQRSRRDSGQGSSSRESSTSPTEDRESKAFQPVRRARPVLYHDEDAGHTPARAHAPQAQPVRRPQLEDDDVGRPRANTQHEHQHQHQHQQHYTQRAHVGQVGAFDERRMNPRIQQALTPAKQRRAQSPEGLGAGLMNVLDQVSSQMRTVRSHRKRHGAVPDQPCGS